MNTVKIKITDHAIQRYRERVGSLPDDNFLSKIELFSRLFSAKPKHFRKLLKGKKTSIVPLSDCFLVFSKRSMVTVLGRTEGKNPALFVKNR